MPRRPAEQYTAYMKSLRDTLLTKSLAEGSIHLYISKLRTLNGGDFTSLSFLKNIVSITEKLDAMENLNTRKSYTTAIVSILSSIPSTKAYQGYLTKYRAMLNTQRDEFLKINQNEKTDKQKENWVEWNEVVALHKQMAEECNNFTTDDLNDNNTNIVKYENYVLLSLYTMFPPRRNQDYYEMKVGAGTDKDFNYYDPDKNQFIFNRYKTAKTHGTEKFTLPASLSSVIEKYIDMCGVKNGDYMLFKNDTKRTQSNLITRRLNSIFGKKVGASMLRHIYDTHKYGSILKEMKQDAEKMGHSETTQRDYIKID